MKGVDVSGKKFPLLFAWVLDFAFGPVSSLSSGVVSSVRFKTKVFCNLFGSEKEHFAMQVKEYQSDLLFEVDLV